MLSNRAESGFFDGIKACFKNAGLNELAQIDCRRRFDRFFAEVREKRRDLLGPLPPLEVYARLAALSGDSQGVRFSKDVYALRGVINDLETAREFEEVKTCFQQAGPQPAIRQICRQNLDRFHAELMRENALLFRDLEPEAIRKRLFAVADEGNAIFGVGETTAFDSLRKIRKAQQEEKEAAARAMATAQRYYCRPSASRRVAPLEAVMASDGVCLCAYGGRFLGSTPAEKGRPVKAVCGQCGAAGRFKIADLNRGSLMHGDWITLQAIHGGYVSVHRNGFVYADRQQAGKFEKFRVVRPSNRPGQIQPGEMVTLISPRGVYLTTNVAGGGALRGIKNLPQPHEYFVLVR